MALGEIFCEFINALYPYAEQNLAIFMSAYPYAEQNLAIFMSAYPYAE